MASDTTFSLHGICLDASAVDDFQLPDLATENSRVYRKRVEDLDYAFKTRINLSRAEDDLDPKRWERSAETAWELRPLSAPMQRYAEACSG